MRYVVYGAGAIGGAIGAELHQAGCEVVLIARGQQLEAVQAHGLTLQTPEVERRSALQAVGSPREIKLTTDDVVLLAMKSQDTAPALDELTRAADPDVTMVCAQNGVENERLALRRFERVYGMFVYVSAQLLEPGVIQVFSAPTLGVLDLGRVPRGSDERAEAIAADLRASGFASRVDREIMRWKYGKLLSNLANAVEALLGPEARGGELVRRAREEALDCYSAAGIDYASREEIAQRAEGHEELRPVDGQARSGGSSWQSLARESRGIETGYLNGEIVLLGRLHRICTPVNRALTDLALRAANEGVQPGSLTKVEIEEAISRPSG
ncbi:MAG: 2-dehydropantoate 2-reductase [Solirubrobacteraceae bacterium]|jgi:2-dehydropantoate 2-reductase|nr:2-dehydropantoate 2-reductase [Solirubrobacteraceae bacterium]